MRRAMRWWIGAGVTLLVGCGGGASQAVAPSAAPAKVEVAVAPTASASAVPAASASTAPAERPKSPGVAGSVALGAAKLEYVLPSPAWKVDPPDEKNGVRWLGFSREPIGDADGRSVLPHMAIIVQPLDQKMDVIAYSMEARLRVPFHVDRVFNWQDEPRLAIRNAVAYEGQVTYDDGLLHRVVIVHAVEGAFGIQVIADSTDSVFASARPEFFDFLANLAIRR